MSGKIEKKKAVEPTNFQEEKSKCLFAEEKKVSEKSVPNTPPPTMINGSSLRAILFEILRGQNGKKYVGVVSEKIKICGGGRQKN